MLYSYDVARARLCLAQTRTTGLQNWHANTTLLLYVRLLWHSLARYSVLRTYGNEYYNSTTTVLYKYYCILLYSTGGSNWLVRF